MLAILNDYMERLNEIHTQIDRVLDGLSPQALDWVPGPQMNSLAVLAAHVAASERFWIGDVVGQVSSQRVRDDEFRTHAIDAAGLRQRLNTSAAFSRQVVETLTLDDLTALRTPPDADQAPEDDRKYTVMWALLHALEHNATHLGQMQQVRQLWEIETKIKYEV